ncbi:MAG: ABC transporter permease, partial [Cyanobacteria bacterium]|nr:ABC transporter permease [Cyanobacteriota bacterium]
MTLVLLLKTFIFRYLLKNKVRSGLTILGIALGVAIMLAIHLANQSVLANFKQSVETISGKTNLVIRSRSLPYFNESILGSLKWIWDVQGHMSPVLEQTAALPQETSLLENSSGGVSGGAGEVVQVIGLNMFNPDVFEQYGWTFPQETSTVPLASEFSEKDPLGIFQDHTAFVGKRLAQHLGLQKPSPIATKMPSKYSQNPSFSLLVNDGVETFFSQGILSGEGLGGAYSGNVLLMDIGAAQSAFHQEGNLSRIDLVVPEAVRPQVEAKLKATLPPGLVVERPEQRGEQIEKMVRSFQYNLTALSFIALLVGAFLIYNTMSISVLRRRQEIGTLRALGATQQTVFTLFLLEAFLLGAVGTGLGILGGIGLSQLALESVSKTVEALYVSQPVSQLFIEPAAIGLAIALGMGLTLLASLPPVFEAMGVSPAESTRRRSDEVKTTANRFVLAGIGGSIWLLGAFAAFQDPVGDLPLFGYFSALCAVLGGAFLMPGVVAFLLRLSLGGMKRLFGFEGRLAH